MLAGQESIVDALGCEPNALASLDQTQAVCERVIAELNLIVVGEPQWHVFPEPGGVTGMYLLTESHLTVHTFPELGLATFNLYCCRPRKAWDWESQLTRLLGAERVTIRTLARGSSRPATKLAEARS